VAASLGVLDNHVKLGANEARGGSEVESSSPSRGAMAMLEVSKGAVSPLCGEGSQLSPFPCVDLMRNISKGGFAPFCDDIFESKIVLQRSRELWRMLERSRELRC
jgi:hypothetical protein